MTGRYGKLLAVVLALVAPGAAGSAFAQTLDDAQRQALERQNLERQERDLTAGIRERNARLQTLERGIGALERNKDKASATDRGKSARYNARINRLKDERSRLHKANQADILERNRLRGKR
ncbi:MAG: hypothetical protein RIB59_06510 [Rhodospirillales bacterium]